MTGFLAFLAKYRKFEIAAVAGVVVVGNQFIAGGSIHWVDVAAAIAGSLGVFAVPNTATAAAAPSVVVPPKAP
jgi:type IV secretory pathway VirB2 component (pilin)